MKKNGFILEAFWALVRAGLWEREVRPLQYNEIDYLQVLKLAEEHNVVGLVTAGLEHVADVEVPQTVRLIFVGKSLLIEQRNIAMNQFVADMVSQMRSANVEAVLAKGQGVAQCYERPLWRASGDIDLLVANDNYIKAVALLKPIASICKQEGRYSKHLGLTIDGWYVELHGTMRSGLSSRLDKEIDAVQQEIFKNVKRRVWRNNNTDVFLPAPNDDVFIVFTHFIKHFYKGRLTIRQLCDWCRLLWTYRDEIDSYLLEKRLCKAGLMIEWRAFASMAVDYLGMPVEAMPLYDTDKRFHKLAVKLVFHINRGYEGKRFLTASNLSKIFPLKTVSYMPAIIVNLNMKKITERLKMCLRLFLFISLIALSLQAKASQNIVCSSKAADIVESINEKKIYLPENKKNGKCLLTQSLFKQANTTYVIQHTYELLEDIEIPSDCVLEFDGGSLNNGRLKGNNTIINANACCIFNRVVLSGSFENIEYDVRWFGVKENREESASENTLFFNNYIIPSVTDIGGVIHVKGTPDDKYYINSTVDIGGNSLICDGTIVYIGDVSNTALIVGGKDYLTTQNHYKIRLTQKKDIRTNYSNKNGIDIIPDNYGLKCYNLNTCTLDIDEVEGFAKEVTLIACDSIGFVLNRINVLHIGRYPYYCLKLTTERNGWISDNLFICSTFKNYKENPLTDNYAIWIDPNTNNSSYSSNNNIFIKPECEHFYACVKVKMARDNFFIGLRGEDSKYPLVVDDGYSRNNCIIGNELNYTGSIGTNHIDTYENIFNWEKLAEAHLNQFVYKDNRIDYYGGSNLLTKSPIGGTGAYMLSIAPQGWHIDTKNAKTFMIKANKGCKLYVTVFDKEGNRIILNSNNCSQYIESKRGSFVNQDGDLQSGTDTQTELIVTVSSKVSSIFLGAQDTDNVLSIYCRGHASLLDLDKIGQAKNIPFKTTGFYVGEKLWITALNKYVYWTGNSWVDALGQEVK